MSRVLYLVPLAVAATTAGAVQYAAPYVQPTAQNYGVDVGYSLNDWRRLRASSGYSFADYARFLNSNPGWPEEKKLRGWAERAMHPGENAATVLTYFAKERPQSGNGWARLADAYVEARRPADALTASRWAWSSPDLSTTDDGAIWARYSANLTRADHDARIDALLFDKQPQAAQRFLALASPARQAAFAARIAMQSNAPDAEARYGAVIGQVTSDAGLMMDRARFLRGNGYANSSQDLFARSHQFSNRPADVDRFLEMALILAGEAQQARQYQTAYNIARQLDDLFANGADVTAQSYGMRDKYTSLAWLGGRVAYDRLNNWIGAAALFERFGRGGKSLQVVTKGSYWAGRSYAAAGRSVEGNALFARAAAQPELFYGQLALERLGRAVPAPPAPANMASPTQRAAFNSRRLVQAMRVLAQQGRSTEQALFVQALATSLDNDGDRMLALDFGQQLGRQDIPVWVARQARNNGSSFYVRQAYPSLPNSGSAAWSLVHGITRQESSFDPYAMSHAGALGMMQLMRPTAREQAGKMGLGYDANRLLSDPNYNVALGSAYLQRMLSTWNGSYPLAIASYNAGAGNVRKWIRGYGDPRSSVDMVRWIEAIPILETRGYVQRVVENAVVYDAISRAPGSQSALHVSRYLGKSTPG
ncbi:MAG: transglycosylase SLT domain-containing protein [Sphingomicrobium sp.]